MSWKTEKPDMHSRAFLWISASFVIDEAYTLHVTEEHCRTPEKTHCSIGKYLDVVVKPGYRKIGKVSCRKTLKIGDQELLAGIIGESPYEKRRPALCMAVDTF